jgi:tyrosine-protein kinase Etk/Wzc
MDNSPNPPDKPEEEIHLLDYLLVLAKHSRLIILVPAAVLVLVYLMNIASPNEYTATARLLPPQENLSMSGQLLDMVGSGVKPGGAGGGGLSSLAYLFGLKSPGDLYVGILTGETVFNQIIERFNLKELYKQKTLVDTRKALKSRAKISVDKKDGLISVAVTDASATRAADLGNAFIGELDKLLQNLAVQEATGRLAFLEKEMATTNAKLIKAEEALRSFSEKNSVIQIDTQTRGMLQYIAQLRAEIDAKEVQVQVMRQQATPYNYDVIRLETQVKGLKDKLQAAEKQWDQSCIGDVCLTTSKMPLLGLEYIRLYREVKYQETLNQLYTRMVEIARLDLVKDVAVVQVVDQATPPDKRSNRRFMPAVLVGMGVFLIMICSAFLLEAWQNSKGQEDHDGRLTLLKKYVQPWKDSLHFPIPWLKKKF